MKKTSGAASSQKQRIAILVGGAVITLAVLIGVIVLIAGCSRGDESEEVDEITDSQVKDESDKAPDKTDITFAPIYNEHCVTVAEKQVWRLAKPQKTLTLLVSLQDMVSEKEVGHTFSQLFYEITDALGIDQKQVMTDEVLDKIMPSEYSVEMQFGAVRIVQFVFEGTYFVSFVVVDGHDSIYDNSAGPVSTEYTLLNEVEVVDDAEKGKTEGVVTNDAPKSPTAPAINTSSTTGSSANTSHVTKPTTPVTAVPTPTKPIQKPEEKPVELDTSMEETASEWGNDANVKSRLAAAYKYVYSGREFKLSDDGTELTLELTADEMADRNQGPVAQKYHDMDATVFMMSKNEKRYDYFEKEILAKSTTSKPLVICNLEQGIRYNTSKGSWTLYLKLRPKAKC